MMLTPDFSNQQYVAEVLRTTGGAAVPTAIERLTAGKWDRDTVTTDAGSIAVHHGFVPSPVAYHRATRTIKDASGHEVSVPRTKVIRGQEQYLYDLFVLQRDRDVVIAVPFHALAMHVFVKVDKQLAGTRILYERLNLTNMVIKLGATGQARILGDIDDETIVITRCHLAYVDRAQRGRDLEQVRLSGANLGASPIYADLIAPVLRPAPRLAVTPIMLGFALYSGGVRKTSATTDLHGNFKLTVGPGLRQVTRLFHLLDSVQEMRNVVSTTTNLPILQSQAIAESVE